MDFIFEVLPKSRLFFEKVLNETSLEDLNKIPDGFNNNIVWNIAHVVVTEQLLAYKLSGLEPNVSADMIQTYMKGTKPQGSVSQEFVDELKTLLFSTIEKTEQDYKDGHFTNFQEYTVSTTGNTLKTLDDALRFILFHEGLHSGYVMALMRALKS